MIRKLLLIITLLFKLSSLLAQKQLINIQHFNDADGYSQSMVQGVIQTQDGYIWLATWDGLYRYDGYHFKNYKARPGDKCPLEVNRITFIKEAEDGNIICRVKNNFYIFNRKTCKFLPYNNKVDVRMYRAPKEIDSFIKSLPTYLNKEVRLELVDNQQGIWVYSHRGLERITMTASPIPNHKWGNDSEEFIRGLYKDKQNRLWIADKNSYVRIVNDHQQSVLYLSPQGQLVTHPTKFGHNIYCLMEDSFGNMWLGAKPDGLFCLKPNGKGYNIHHFTHHPAEPYSISNNSIYHIIEDDAHRLLIATFGGGINIIEQPNSSHISFINPNNRLKNYPKEAMECRCLLMVDKTLLIGTTLGLYAIHHDGLYESTPIYGNIRKPDVEWSISNNYIMNMVRTRNGKIFITTSGGGTDLITSQQLLSDTIHFKHYTTTNGMSSDMNMSLVEDTNNRLWIVSEASLSCLDPQKDIITNYTKSIFDGGFVFSEVMPLCTNNGELIIGTTQGTLQFNPQTIAKSNFNPQIVFECDSIITLQRGQHDFSIRFAAIDYNKKEDIIYAYQMEGIDQEWHYTKHNELNYVGLKPGDYRLHVRSTNGDGIWADNEKVISIHRPATFHETPWAWMLYGSLIAVLLVGATWLYRYIWKLRQEIKDIQLNSDQTIFILGERIKELLSINENPEIREADTETLNDEDRIFAEKTKSFIETNISNSDLSVNDFALELGVSRTVLYARIKKIFDSSPNNLVLNMRIEHAKKLLLQSGAHISNTAYACGFSDPKYFSRCFKKLTGKSPSEYMNC